jgi:AraC family transcriptional regulator
MKQGIKPPGGTETTTLLVKNMVCNRCVRVVREDLERLGLDVRSVQLGEVVVGTHLPAHLREAVSAVLRNSGFELVEDRRVRTIEQIKHAVIKLVQRREAERQPGGKYSDFIAREVGQSYHALSTLFSSVENITVEHYIILQKIERTKELLKYGELTLSEIAWQLGYSSVQHLSSQFKKVTGLTPSRFKTMITSNRTPIDQVADPVSRTQ